MPVANNVSLTSPYAAEQQSIERRRRLAELMQQQSMQQQPTEMAGGWAIPQGPLAGVSKLAQALAGAYGQRQADERTKALADRVRGERTDTITRATDAMRGTPERYMGEAGTADEIYQPAVPGDMRKGYEILAGSNDPALQTVGLTNMLKPAEKIDAGNEILMVQNGQVVARYPKGATPDARLRADTTLTTHNTPSASTLATVAGADARHDRPSGSTLATINAAGKWGDPYMLNGVMVQKNETTGQIRTAVTREPQTRVSVAAPVTVARITDPNDPTRMIEVDARTYRGGSLGSPGVIGVSGRETDAQKREGKRQFNMQGLGQTIQTAEDLLGGITRGADGQPVQGAPLPTGSGVGALVDRAAGFFGASPGGAVQATQLEAVGGALKSKMPRMEGPQSDRDTILYGEMAGKVGDRTVPIAQRRAALEEVKRLWLKYERLNPEAFEDRRQGGGGGGVVDFNSLPPGR